MALESGAGEREEMPAQFLTISRLSNIIHMIGLGQQSGILRVVRGQGPTREIGQIKFINGEPVSALLGQLTGPNALAVLNNWGECIYSFAEQPVPEASDADFAADALNRLNSDAGRPPPNTGLPSGSWPSYGYTTSSSMTPGASGGGFPLPMSTPAGTNAPGFGGQSANSGYYGGYAPHPGSGADGSRPMAPPAVQVSEALSPDQLALRPRRTFLADRVEHLPLDRRERMVVLLVDGRRNLSDLARLTRRTEREVLVVLNHLAGLGLIQLEG
jgi:hypothetical protein